MEDFFEEMKRYVRFGVADEVALRAFSALASPQFRRISEEFYDRLAEHPDAHRVFSGPDQIARLKNTLCDWMDLLLKGPWDAAYHERRQRIGRMHVRIDLPQRYMFGAMDVIRVSLVAIAHETVNDHDSRVATVAALHKILDLELGIMLETYREAYVDKVQDLERKDKERIQAQLQISEASYAQVIEAGEVVVVTCDREGHILLFNHRAEKLTGMPREQAVGLRWQDLFLPTARHTEATKTADLVLSTGRAYPMEAAVSSPELGERLVRWHFTSLPSASGPIVCAMGLDVTEEHDLTIRTSRAERLASLGTMAAGLAHEIRNPLNAAHLQLSLVQRRLQRGGDVDTVLAAAELASGEMKRLAQLVEEFLQFSRPQPLRLARADLRAACETIVSLVAPEAEAQGVELVLDPGEPVVSNVDEERLKQVILNLVRNAVEATGRGGHVRVSVDRDGIAARLQVEDDGPGLPSDAPIFEPFYTTKEKGTGLGLTIAHRIIADHAGRIDVESRPGRTLFTITLGPRSA